jgi:aryl-alcohol dehydrogenase-like predicted oxidoreductase
MVKLKFTRRQFLTALSMSTGYMMFSNPLKAHSKSLISTDPFQRVKLGNSGLETTLLGFGTGHSGFNGASDLTRRGREEGVKALRHAYDTGIRMFDCADQYGTHPFMADALKFMPREEVTIISKMWVTPRRGDTSERPDANTVVERFRKEMQTDMIDLMQLHCMTRGDWTETYRKEMDVLENLKAKGTIRAHGVSVHSTDAMKAALASPWVDVIHARINPYGISMDQPEPAEVVSLIHDLHNSGKGVIGMKMIGNGKYTDDSEMIDNTLRFVLGLGSVDMIIVGFDNPEHIDDYTRRMKTTLTAMAQA